MRRKRRKKFISPSEEIFFKKKRKSKLHQREAWRGQETESFDSYMLALEGFKQVYAAKNQGSIHFLKNIAFKLHVAHFLYVFSEVLLVLFMSDVCISLKEPPDHIGIEMSCNILPSSEITQTGEPLFKNFGSPKRFCIKLSNYTAVEPQTPHSQTRMSCGAAPNTLWRKKRCLVLL